MSARVITVAMTKGGVGKTTTVTNLAAVMTNDKKKVLVVDIDPQADATDELTGFTRVEDHFRNKTVLDMLLAYQTKPSAEYVSPTKFKHIDIIPSGAVVTKIEETLGLLKSIKGKEPEEIMADCLSGISENYDYILVDTPPRQNVIVSTMLTISDFVLLPYNSDGHSVSGLEATIQYIYALEKEKNVNIPILGLLSTATEKYVANKAVKMIVEDSQYAKYMLKSEIRKGQAVKDGTLAQVPAVFYAPKSKVSGDYSDLWSELKKRIKKMEAQNAE